MEEGEDEKMAVQVLSDGREFAYQLGIMFGKGLDSDSLLSAGDLLTKILDSFQKSLSILQIPDETSHVPGGSCDGGPVKSEELDSGQSSKTVKDRRGCYKRRRISEAETKVSGGLVEDGHAWRKYGQKSILNAKYPRNYYRCTHKFEQGCLATKQVQKTEEEPPMYRSTYYGHHTCRNDLNQFLFVSSSSSPDLSSSNSLLLSFQNNIPTFSPKQYSIPTTCFNNTANNYNYNPSDYYRDDILNTFGSSPTPPRLSPDVISNSGLYSSTTTSTMFDDQMMVKNLNFDDDNLVTDSFFL